MEEKDYLELWRNEYSFPQYITGLLGINQIDLLMGTAVGTTKNYYLDPKPLKNKLGEIYSSIINLAYNSARTDAIKMNRRNMDYTCGCGSEYNKAAALYEYFWFNSGEEITSEKFFSKEENGFLPILDARRIEDDILDGDKYPDSFERILYYTKTLKTYEESLFKDYNIKEDEQKDYWISVICTKTEIEENGAMTQITIDGFIPSNKYVELWNIYAGKNGTQQGLQLLMPQYKRRVEVEDLNENFWVISQILDATVNALWGPYSLIDVVRQLIYKIGQFNEKNDVIDIVLSHDGSEDLFFDMYSRFTLPGLELKLKTEEGERVIKNIFKEHSNKSDRDSTTDGFKEKEKLFNHILSEMYRGDKEYPVDDTGAEIYWPNENDTFSGLYDSDIIRSDVYNNTYISLSSVIDLINEKIVENKPFTGYTYAKKEGEREFFECIDSSIGDGTFTVEDYENLKNDIEKNFVNSILTPNEYQRLTGYEKSYNYLLDENTKIEDTSLLKQINKDNIEDFYLQQFALVKPDINGSEEQNFSIQTYQDELGKIYYYFGTFNFNNNLFSSEKYYPETFDILYEQYKNILSVCTYNEVSEGENQAGWTVFTIPPQIVKYKITDIEKFIEPFGTGEDALSYYERVNKGFTYEDLKLEKDKGVTENDEGGKVNKVTIKLSSIVDKLNNFFNNKLTFSITEGKEEEIIFNLDPGNSKIIDINDEISIKTKEEAMSISEFNSEIDITCIANSASCDSKVLQFKYETSDNNIVTCRLYLYYSVDLIENLKNALFTSGQTITTSTPGNILIYKGQKDIKDEEVKKQIISTETITGSIVFETIQYNQYNFKKLKLERAINYKMDKIPIYSYQVSEALANYLSETSEEKKKADPEIMKVMLNISGDNEVNVRDAAAIARNTKDLNSEYISKMLEINNLVEKYYDKTIEEISTEQNLDTFFNNLGISSSDLDNLKTKIFIYVDNPLKDFAFLTSFHKPTHKLLDIIKQIDNSDKNSIGIDWSKKEDIETLRNSVNEVEYSLCDNILIYLFDADYYCLKKEKEYFNLYIAATDSFFNSNVNPLIKGEVFTDSVPLFVPRKDLRNGEIIELRLSGGNEKKRYNFEKALNYVLDNSEQPSLINIENNTVSLKLHNSFANNIFQYNYRTALFFKDTTPSYFNTRNETNPGKIDDLFNQGIGVTYFKPIRVLDISTKSTQTLVSKQLFDKDLKIYANMIASKYNYIDNSYELSSSIGHLPTKTVEGDYSNILSEHYIFEKKLAYCAATRNNLIFYSSPSQNEYGQYLHSPLMALESPNKFAPSTTIQTSVLSNKGILGLKTAERVSIPYDVLGSYIDNNGKIIDINNATITGIKDMLYRNAYEDKPPLIEICWGRRKVDEYIKEKNLKYIVIEREEGDRHKTYAPTCAGISFTTGYLHSKEGITSIYEGNHYIHPILWYDQNGKPLSYNVEEAGPREAVYGVIDLTNIISQQGEKIYSSNFLIRFYNSAPKVFDKNSEVKPWTREEFLIKIGEENTVRRPIIKKIYFFGESASGKCQN